MNDLLSIIIPVYQASSYLDRCIYSVLASSYSNLEVILVDDGSTDASPSIMDGWALADPRIKVIHQTNQGVSSARNAGLSAATGTFVTFMDADDRIAPGAYETVLSHFSPDVCCVAFKVIICDKDGQPFNDAETLGPIMYFDTVTEALEHYWYKGRNNSVWCRIFRNDILQKEHILFPTNLTINEEGFFITEYLRACTGRVIQLNDRLYYYTTDPSGAPRHISEEQATGLLQQYPQLIDDLSKVSARCSDQCRLRYTELLPKLLRSGLTGSDYSSGLMQSIRRKMREYAHHYLSSKDVAKPRKLYYVLSLIAPRLTFALADIMKPRVNRRGGL